MPHALDFLFLEKLSMTMMNGSAKILEGQLHDYTCGE
jgi:hypothetical protein